MATANGISKLLTVVIVVLCLAGVAVSSVVLREHYSTDSSPCNINDVWDCGTVNHSPYAAIHGVPVAMIGILGYALLAVLAGRFPWTTAVLALAALVFSLRMTWIEWKILLVWCIYCVSSQILIAIIFPLTVVAAWLSRRALAANQREYTRI
ncbi:MAG TPA: vitamin K epoxide reductase family protein [Candidatus Angelobacter sp.]